MSGTTGTILAILALPVGSFALSYGTTAWYEGHHSTEKAVNASVASVPRCDEDRNAAMDGWTCSDWTPVEPVRFNSPHIYRSVADTTRAHQE